MRVSVEMDDWLITMGMVGLYRMVTEAGHEIEVSKVGLSFDVNILKDLPNAYFNLMMKKYSVAKRDSDYIKGHIQRALNKETFKVSTGYAKTQMNAQIDKVKKYFEDTPEYATLATIREKMKELSNYEDLPEWENLTNEFISIMESEHINDKLTANYFKASILTPFFGQPSFLNVSKNALTKQEQIDLLYKDYIQPVLDEARLTSLLQQDNPQLIHEFLKDTDHNSISSMRKLTKKLSSVEEIKNTLDQHYHVCSIFPEFFALSSFEEMIFSPLGVSKKDARNFYHPINESDRPVPLSSLARLLLFCAPAGAAIYNKTDGVGRNREQRRYSGFVLSNQSFKQVLADNDLFALKKERRHAFDEVIYELLDHGEDKSNMQLKQIFLVEFHADYQSKKTLLDYLHLPEYVARYFIKHGKEIRKIKPFDARERFTRSILKGIDPQQIIFEMMRANIVDGIMNSYSIYTSLRERNRLNSFRKGVEDDMASDKQIYFLYHEGKRIRGLFVNARSSNLGEEEVYRAGGDKKLVGVSHRLVNAVRAGNRKTFFESLFHLYLSTNQQIPSVFLQAWNEENVDFVTVGSAFIAGLLPGEEPKKPNNDKEGDK